MSGDCCGAAEEAKSSAEQQISECARPADASSVVRAGVAAAAAVGGVSDAGGGASS